MKNNGFIFWDVIVSLLIIGIIIIVSFPVFTSAFNRLSSVNAYSDVNYLGEYIFERLNSYDEYCEEILSDIEKNKESTFEDLDAYYLERYDCELINQENNKYLWELKLTIYLKGGRESGKYVEFEGSIPKK